MTKFVVGRPVTTTTPTVVVDAGLAVGSHRFRLTVVDSSGNTSQPAEAPVQVSRGIAPLITSTTVTHVTSPTITRTPRKTPAKPRRPAR